jgi:alpha-mannosidase
MRFRFAGQKIGRVTEDTRDGVSGFVHQDKLRFKMFPAFAANAVGIRDLPFAVSETTDPYINGLYWTAVAGEGKGIAVFNRGTMGAVRERDGGFSVPLAYAAYYIWGTRMLSGDFEYEFALYPFTGGRSAADLHRRAVEYNFPAVGATAAVADGSLGQTFRPVQVESPDAIVSALYSRGGKTCVRIYEYRGTGGTASLDYAAGPARMIQVDLAGRDLGASSNVISVKPWEIKTVRLEHAIE